MTAFSVPYIQFYIESIQIYYTVKQFDNKVLNINHFIIVVLIHWWGQAQSMVQFQFICKKWYFLTTIDSLIPRVELVEESVEYKMIQS